MRVLATALALFFPAVYCQTAAPPAFEVASVKPAPLQPLNHVSVRMSVNSGRLTYTNVSLTDILKQAYTVQDDQVSGPSWIATERFDIRAALPAGVSRDLLPQMLQALLRERFRLALHRETKSLPQYSLAVSKTGPKFRASESTSGINSESNRVRRHIAGKVTMAMLADFLAKQLGRPVVDQTGLNGPFEIALDWAPDTPAAADPAAQADVAQSGPSLLTAVQEQLGLRLTGGKGPVEVLVIDHVERVPVEN